MRNRAQKLMENTYMKKKTGAALKFPPGFFTEDSFGSNFSHIESESSSKSQPIDFECKNSLGLKLRHSCTLKKVNNPQLQG